MTFTRFGTNIETTFGELRDFHQKLTFTSVI